MTARHDLYTLVVDGEGDIRAALQCAWCGAEVTQPERERVGFVTLSLALYLDRRVGVRACGKHAADADALRDEYMDMMRRDWRRKYDRGEIAARAREDDGDRTER